MTVYPGDIVIVKAYPDRELERYVVDVKPPLVILTTNEERQKASRENREPMCVGFRMKDILSIKESY